MFSILFFWQNQFFVNQFDEYNRMDWRYFLTLLIFSNLKSILTHWYSYWVIRHTIIYCKKIQRSFLMVKCNDLYGHFLNKYSKLRDIFAILYHRTANLKDNSDRYRFSISTHHNGFLLCMVNIRDSLDFEGTMYAVSNLKNFYCTENWEYS